MADTNLTLISDRYPSGMSVLSGTSSNVDGDADEGFIVPATFGDCLVFADQVAITAIATLVANPELLGVRRYIGQVVSGSLLHGLPVTRWTKTGAVVLSTSVEYYHPVLLRTGEKYTIQYVEADTNATPAGDLVCILYVKRLRSP